MKNFAFELEIHGIVTFFSSRKTFFSWLPPYRATTNCTLMTYFRIFPLFSVFLTHQLTSKFMQCSREISHDNKCAFTSWRKKKHGKKLSIEKPSSTSTQFNLYTSFAKTPPLKLHSLSNFTIFCHNYQYVKDRRSPFEAIPFLIPKICG